MKRNLVYGIVGIVVLLLALFYPRGGTGKVGSIGDGQAYNSTTTDLMVGGGISRTSHLVKIGYGLLGSVVITTSAQGALTLYDGTTTVNGAVYGTTTLMKIAAAATVGTYQCDCTFNRGLLLYNDSGAIASSTITYR